MANHIPDLDSNEGSWVVTRRSDSEVIGEFFDRKIVERFNLEKVIVETIGQYLGRINQEIARESRKQNDLT